MLSEMSACAHRMGVGFAAQAEATDDWERKLELIRLFDRCFFSVRVSIALQLRLRREGRAAAFERPTGAETADAEPLEIETPEALETDGPADDSLTYDERDRDREVERASLPLLLKTLEGVAADAAALPGPPLAALPALNALLARASGDTATARRPAGGGLRARLAGATAAPPPPQTPTPRLAAQVRRPRPATGPPRR